MPSKLRSAMGRVPVSTLKKAGEGNFRKAGNGASQEVNAFDRQRVPAVIQEVTEIAVARCYTMDKASRIQRSPNSDVFFGVRNSDGIEVAIKTLYKSSRTRRQEKEWRDTAEYLLHLPPLHGLCRTYEALETPSTCHLVIERCKGKDLFAQLSDGKLKTEHEIAVVVHQLLKTMRELHLTGRIHKDLKLKNVVANINGQAITVKVIDLDTVTEYVPDKPAKVVLGSDGYIAPEAYCGHYSPASDVYAVGVILYRLITKKFPHDLKLFDDKPGENYPNSEAMIRINQRLRTTPIDFARPPLNTMPDAADLLRRLLAINPNSRICCEGALKHRWFCSNHLPTCSGDGFPLPQKSVPSEDVYAVSTCDTFPDLSIGDDDDDDAQSIYSDSGFD